MFSFLDLLMDYISHCNYQKLHFFQKTMREFNHDNLADLVPVRLRHEWVLTLHTIIFKIKKLVIITVLCDQALFLDTVISNQNLYQSILSVMAACHITCQILVNGRNSQSIIKNFNLLCVKWWLTNWSDVTVSLLWNNFCLFQKQKQSCHYSMLLFIFCWKLHIFIIDMLQNYICSLSKLCNQFEGNFSMRPNRSLAYIFSEWNQTRNKSTSLET